MSPEASYVNLRVCFALAAFVALFFAVSACGTGVRTPLGDIYWTQFQQHRQAAREEAAARYRYCPEGGCLIRLEKVQIEPLAVQRGESLSVITTFTLLTAEEGPIPVTISRDLLRGREFLGRIKEITTTQANGTWSQKVDFTMPPGAGPGLYTLATRISTPYGSHRMDTQFTVK